MSARSLVLPFSWSVVLSLLVATASWAAEGGDAAAAAEVAVDAAQVTALHDAARDGDLETVRTLLDAGVPVDAGNHYQVTALMYAAGWGHADVVRELLGRGADQGHVDNLYQADAMTWASSRGHVDAVGVLVEAGADPSSAWFGAISEYDGSLVAMLLATGKIPQALLDGGLSMAANDDDVEEAQADAHAALVKQLEKAGGTLPEPSSYTIAPEVLARYPGTYAFEQAVEYKAEVTLADGALTVTFGGNDPIELEALDDVRFRQPRSSFFEAHFNLEEGTVKSVSVKQVNRPAPFLFVREEKPTGGDSAPAAEEVVAEQEAEATEEQVAHLPIPKIDGGAHWTGFRGSGTAGTAAGSPPVTWDTGEGTNVLWKAPIPGRSHASPIVWGDKIFVATVVSSVEEGAFRTGLYGDPDFIENDATYSWQLLALDRATGKVLWQRTAHEGKPRAKHHIKATQLNATPVTDGRHVVTVMGSEGLFCYDVEGNLLWRKDLGTLSVGWFYDDGFEWGHSSSPILYQDRVILQVDRAREPFIAAYALADGKEIWKTSRDNIPSWGTPALLEGPDGVEIVTNGSRKIRGYDAETGKELWSLGPHSEVTVGSVVTGQGLAFAVGNWRPIRAIYAIRPGGRGDISLADEATSNEHIAWHLPRGGTYVPTPLVYGDTFYTLANNGVLVAYDAATGERHYRARVAGRGGAAFSASPVAAGGRLYVAGEDGDVFVVRHGRSFELLAENKMDEIIMASPAISGDVLLIRTLENLYAIGAPKKQGEAAGR